MSAIVDATCRAASNRVKMSDILTERTESNIDDYPICSVSVSMGVVNQIEYLGRSFAAKTTTHYNVVHHGDIVYTKSPTGNFPYGIIKRSDVENPVAVSPLYGVYVPNSEAIGLFLHEMFSNSIKAKNYLHPLIQKGAKNTIIISNQRFLENYVLLPESETLDNTVKILTLLNEKLMIETSYFESLNHQKSFLLSAMFI